MKTIAIYTITSSLHDQEAGYFLTDPIGNHHIIIPGHHKALFEEFLAS